MAKILVIRFSAIGDVAMTIPVVYSFAKQYPEHQITVLSRDVLEPLFRERPDNVDFMGVDLKNEYKGFTGLNHLYKKLKSFDFDYVADLHDVLRSQYLRFRFQCAGVSIARIHKGRNRKRKLVRRYCKVLQPQLSSFERYENVFRSLGFSITPDFNSIYGKEKGDVALFNSIISSKGNNRWIGIAPFAKHKGKIYPLDRMEEVVMHFARNERTKVFLFGGGKKEQEVIDKWTSACPSLISMVGKLDMNAELSLMSHLDVMLSMDSANMHLASLVGIPVVSIWGATHPYAGFMGWGQSEQNAVQIDLSCRPCSIFGNKPCYRKDYACLIGITPRMVIGKVKKIIE